MSLIKKPLSLLTVRCVFAVVIGVCLVAAVPALLQMFGSGHESITKVTTRQMKFPESEEMLNKLSAQLARDGESLSKIEPAAGEEVPPEEIPPQERK